VTVCHRDKGKAVSAGALSLWVVARQNLFRLIRDCYILKILPDIFFERLSPDLPFPSPLGRFEFLGFDCRQ
jgi:hypothetical protein